MNEEIDIILARYFSGEASQKELEKLDLWLAQSEKNEKQFHELSLLYQHIGQKEILQNIDTESALAKIKTHINKKENKKSFFVGQNMLKIAAAITLLLVSSFLIFYFIQQPAKSIHILAVENVVAYELFENAHTTLFQGTEITYNSKKKNEITLIGKASFNIQSDENITTQLVVQAGETFIKDIGTKFTVDATEPENSISVEVSEGEVRFYTNINAGVQVKAGESATYNVDTKIFTVSPIPHTPYLTPHIAFPIHFHNTPLFNAIELIKTHYDVDIIINSMELNEILLNVSFENNESVDYILEIIAATLGAQVSKKDGCYFITLQ